MFTLHELFRLSFHQPVAWLAGDPHAPCTANWVAAAPAEAQPGDILILPRGGLEPEALDRARERGAAAVVLLGPPDGGTLVFPVGLNVAAIPDLDDVRIAQRALLTILVNQRAGLMERGHLIHQQLTQLAAEGAGLDGLARAMSDLSGRGVLVQDKRLQTLAEHPSPDLLSIWSEITAGLGAPDSLPEALRDRKQAGQQGAPIQQALAGGLVRLVAPIRVGEVARGYLSLIGTASGEIDTLDQLVAERGGLVCAAEMARSKAVRETEKRLKGDLLTALLQKDLSARDAALWVHSMDLDLTQAHAALRFAWGCPEPPSRRRLETIVNGEVSRAGVKAIVSSMVTEVVCFCPTPPALVRPAPALALGAAVLAQMQYEHPGCGALCGIGTPAGDLNEWQTSFRHAGQALEMARRLRRSEPLYFADLSVYRLLLQLEHTPELVAFQEETLGALLGNDGGREMIRTLEVYFQHNCNLAQAAESLFIHRNTLVYRLERISESTGLNLDLPETRLAVQLALHIIRMRGLG